MGHGQQLCEVISKSNMAVRSYGPWHGLLLCVHCDIDLGNINVTKVMPHPWVKRTQMCELLSRSNMAMRSYDQDKDLEYVCTVTFTLWPWVSHFKPLGHGQPSCETLSRSNMTVRSYYPDKDLGICAVTLTILSHGQQWWNIIRLNMTEEFLPRHEFWLCVCFDLGDTTFGQG